VIVIVIVIIFVGVTSFCLLLSLLRWSSLLSSLLLWRSASGVQNITTLKTHTSHAEGRTFPGYVLLPGRTGFGDETKILRLETQTAPAS
jgi:hypothetical protein